MALSVVQLEHAGLSVSDLDRSIAFYCDVIGFELVRIVEPFDDDRLGKLTEIPGAKARIAHLWLGKNMLELFEFTEPRGRALSDGDTMANQGFQHIGFRTADTRGDYERLKAQGVEFTTEPIEFREGVWIVYFKGPDGEMLELRQDDHMPLPE